jgi:ATP-dependent DNA helicase RecG
LLHRPRRYEDRRDFGSIIDLHLDEPALTRGTVVALGTKRYRKGAKSIFELILDDGTARLHCRWWNLPFMEKYFQTGDEVVVFGKPLSLKPRTMDHPETEVVEAGEENSIHFNRIVPIYPLTEGLPQRWLRGLVWRTLEGFGRHAERSQARRTESASFHSLPSRAHAVHRIHFPEEMTDVEIARQRLALDEFVDLQLQIQSRRRKFEAQANALPCGGDNHLMKPFLAQLGFKLTGAQTAVLREIRKDMSGRHPMRRLLQGDVGSGKTVVAACAALMALESGFSTALMAPTEILAEQHFQNFKRWFQPLGVQVKLQTGSRKTSALPVGVPTLHIKGAGAQSGGKPSTLFVGTHALLATGFDIPRLGLVIIDEQHKFGVVQREQLVRKGRYPHLLVMTATPIPRTLGLTLYGDLDVSVIDEMPKGRSAVKTFIRATDRLPQVWKFIRERLAQGRQAYVIYPRVDADDTANDTKAVTKEFENVKHTLSPFRVGLLHGRVKSSVKEEVMDAFRKGALQAVVATSLVEVGVDVPNATVMLVENAERFGLAQLHQLRGRIGRGPHESYCILISDADNAESRERLKVLEGTTDGFRIAEADLKLRGPGELLGQHQSGLPRFRFGNLSGDLELIRAAKEIARQATY